MKLYLIPGFGENINSKGYKKIIEMAKEKGYDVIFLNLQIRNNSLIDIVKKQSSQINPGESILIGFSNGALIAYLISTIIPVEKLIVCSISDILGEDTKGIKKYLVSTFGKLTADELSKLNYGISKSKDIIFINGEREKYSTNRVNKLLKANKKSVHLIVNDTGHDLNKKYVDKIISLI